MALPRLPGRSPFASLIRLRAIVAPAVLLLFFQGSLEAQTILNTERFQLSEVDGFHVNANLSMDGKWGNSEVLTVGSSGIVGMRSGRHWTRFIFGGRYLSDRERAILDNRFGQIRYSWIFSERLRSFHFVQGQRNETLRLRSRWLVGSGLRRTLFEGEYTSIAFGTGLMGEWERLDPEAVGEGDPTRLDALRMANQAIVSRDLASGVRVLNILYLQPDVGDFSDMRILNDLGLLVPLSEHVRLTVSAEWRRDTRPPTALEKDDLTFTMSFGVDRR